MLNDLFSEYSAFSKIASFSKSLASFSIIIIKSLYVFEKELIFFSDRLFHFSNDISNDFKVSYFLSFSFKLLNKLNLLDDSKYNKFLNKPKEFFRDFKYTYLRNKYIKS